MGNCMDHEAAGEKKEEERGSIFVKNGVSMKVVLTKEELKWLILQLNNEKGEGVNLEEMLKEIKRGRSSGEKVQRGWKPSLESIFEAPEMLHMDTT